MATIDLKLKSYDELQFEIMKLTTDNYLKQQQIDQLTNNWNELEEWLKQQIVNKAGNSIDLAIENHSYCTMLDKMNEIKDGKNER